MRRTHLNTKHTQSSSVGVMNFWPHSQSTWRFGEQTKVTRCGKKSLMYFQELLVPIPISNPLSFLCKVFIYKAVLPVEENTQLPAFCKVGVHSSLVIKFINNLSSCRPITWFTWRRQPPVSTQAGFYQRTNWKQEQPGKGATQATSRTTTLGRHSIMR